MQVGRKKEAHHFSYNDSREDQVYKSSAEYLDIESSDLIMDSICTEIRSHRN